MKLGSLFDGSGTAPLAAAMCGIEPVWASEIEPYPIRVTKARFPQMQHLGSITEISGADVEPVDIICGGSPCQDLSVAGKQKGLQDGERSHLFFEMTRIIKEMRAATDGNYPRYIIWENVPGAFSSNKGYDFLAVIRAFAEIADPNVYVSEPPCKGKTDRLDWKNAGSIVGDGWSIAWRVVDAQYWGVPQRRRRIYLVLDLTAGRAGEILFERKGLSGDSAEGGEARQKAAADAGRGADGGCTENKQDVIVLNNQGGSIMDVSTDITGTLRAQEHGHQPIACYPLNEQIILRHKKLGKGTGFGAGEDGDPAYTISASHPHMVAAFMGGQGAKARSIAYCDDGTTPTIKSAPSGSNTVPDVVYALQADGIDRADKAVCFQNTGQGWWNQSDIGQTLRTPCGGDSAKANLAVYPQCAGPLMANSHPGSYTGQDAFSDMLPVVPSNKPPRKYIVRRLTPLECCRLQGFPDWWEDGVEGSDSARYKMWGNGMALPNMLHVMRGIAAEEARRNSNGSEA